MGHIVETLKMYRTEYLLCAQARCLGSALRGKDHPGCAVFNVQSKLSPQLSFRDEPFRYEFFAVERDKISFTVECEARQKRRY
jgi:hypothetical protein